MKAPMCRVCGTEHWFKELHAFEVSAKPAAKVVVNRPVVVNTVVNKPKPGGGHGRYSDKVKRAAYQLEWMRKRRAKARKK